MIPLFSRRPDGSTVIELDYEPWRAQWLQATNEEKAVLEDSRPAIRREPFMSGLPPTYVTLRHALWDALKKFERRNPAFFEDNSHPTHGRNCSACKAELKLKREWHHGWLFYCPRCQSSELLGKELYGGTIGAGEASELGGNK